RSGSAAGWPAATRTISPHPAFGTLARIVSTIHRAVDPLTAFPAAIVASVLSSAKTIHSTAVLTALPPQVTLAPALISYQEYTQRCPRRPGITVIYCRRLE